MRCISSTNKKKKKKRQAMKAPSINKNSPIAVLGAGSWGSALALTLARNGNAVKLWCKESDLAHEIHSTRINSRYLPGFIFPENIVVFNELSECLTGVSDILIVVPSHAFREVLTEIKKFASPPVRIAWGTKGIDPSTCRLLGDVVTEIFSSETPMAVLAGPSFAKEVADEKPTAVSLSGNDAQLMSDIRERFHNHYFRLYKNSDFVGVQLCGAVKNVLAIAVGIADGLNLGANTRCALITRGLAEMTRLCVALGGLNATMMSLAGVGDLVLTCTDNQSRNRRFGLAIGQGMTAEAALKEIGQAVEGLTNTRQVLLLAKSCEVEMPITEQVQQILFENQSAKEAVNNLFQRELKDEF
jgi:glycerol-3-phosphate dehydrogenase (NAD(P)+)